MLGGKVKTENKSLTIETIPVVRALSIRPRIIEDFLPPEDGVDLYTVTVSCCNCNPQFKFEVAIPKGEQASGHIVSCPRCEVQSRINPLHQVWPIGVHG